MAETAVALAPVNRAVSEQKPKTNKIGWTWMVWAEMLAFISRPNEIENDPLLDRW